MSDMQTKKTPLNSARNVESADSKDSDDKTSDSVQSPSRNALGDVSERYSELEKRRLSLGNSMKELRQQIAEEKELWRKEIDLILASGREKDSSLPIGCNNSDVQANPSHQIDSILYRSPVSKINDSGSTNKFSNAITSNRVLQEVPTRDSSMPYEARFDDNVIRDYESKITRYQEILAATQAENKSSVRKQLVANAFRRRLQEVENMCTVELMRVRQNISALQPLQNLLSSDWSAYNQDLDTSAPELIDDLCGLPDKDLFSSISSTDINKDFQCLDIVQNIKGQNSPLYSSNEGSLSDEETNRSIDITLEQ